MQTYAGCNCDGINIVLVHFSRGYLIKSQKRASSTLLGVTTLFIDKQFPIKWFAGLYIAGLAFASLAIYYWNLPDNILLFSLVFIILATLYEDRKFYLGLLFLTLPVAFVLVSMHAEGGWLIALVRVAVALVAIVFIGEVSRSVNGRRKEVEKALIKSHDQYRSLLEDINDVAFIINLHGQFQYVSPAIERISGYKTKDLVGRHFSEFVHPDDISVVTANIRDTLAGESKLRWFRVLDVDGSVKHVRIFSRPIYENGALSGVSGIMVDVSDIVIAQQDLQTRQRQMTLLNEITRAALAESEFKTMLLTLSDRLADLFEADGCFITLWEEEGGRVHLAAANQAKRDLYLSLPAFPAEDTITYHVLSTGNPLLIEDVHGTSFVHPLPANADPRSMIAMPLIAEGRWLGAVLIAFDQRQFFTQADLDWTEVVGTQLSLAVYKGWVLQAEKQQRAAADALREAGVALSATLEYDEVLDRLLPQVQKVVPYDTGVILLVSSGKTRVARMWGYEQFYDREVREKIANLSMDITATPNLRKIIETRTPMIIPDATADPEWVKVDILEHVRGWAGVPILIKGEVVALYSLDSVTPNHFKVEQMNLLTAFAAQASLALQNAELYAQARLRMVENETLRRASSAVVSELDLEKVLTQILEQLEHVVPYDSASVFIVEGDHLKILAAKGFEDPSQVVGLKVERDDQLFYQIFRTGQPVIIPNAQKDSRFQGWGSTSYVRGWMGVPMQVQGETIGHLTVDSRQENAYTLQDAMLVSDFAREASIAIQHARLYQRAVEIANRLSILHQASQQVSATLDPQKLYEAIHQAAAQVMPTESFVISVMDDYHNEIEVVYIVDRHGQAPSRRIPPGEGLSGQVIRTGKSYFIRDTLQDLDFEVVRLGDPEPIRSFLAVPMRRQDGEVFGMVSAQSYQVNAYTREDMELLELLASHAAIALDNTRLFTELQRLAVIDDLTGLYNRRHFFELARLEFERARRYRRALSIIMIDIDHFKDVNDRWGHLVGDQVLRAVAQRCKQSIREMDVIGRYGGEEFALLMPETDVDGARQIAERLREAIGETPIQARGETVSVTISIGLASLGQGYTDLDQLISVADESLYHAKVSGRNTIGW